MNNLLYYPKTTYNFQETKHTKRVFRKLNKFQFQMKVCQKSFFFNTEVLPNPF